MPSNQTIVPSQDPWYQHPAGYKTAKPGTILRLRVAPGFPAEGFEHVEGVYNILFASTDSHQRPTWGVTTVFVPTVKKDDALLSYQSTYKPASFDDMPSALAHCLGDYGWAYQIGYINAGLERGWIVNYPDHEGPQLGFGNGVTTGQTLINSIRAVLHAGFGMETEKPRIGLWGFSGGAFASAWAAQLQPQYAPELSFAGVALGGILPDLRFLADLSGTIWAAMLPVTLIGMTKEDPAAHEFLLAQLKETHRERFLSVLHNFTDSVKELAGQDIWAYFRSSRESIMTNPLLQKCFARAQLGNHGVPEAPLFFYQATSDKNAPIADTDALVKKWGDLGVNIHFDRNSMGDYSQEMAFGQYRAIKFLEATLRGTYTHEGWTISEVAMA